MSVPNTRVAAPAAAADRVGPRTVLALSIAEGTRLLRHPVLLVGAAFAVLWSIRPWSRGEQAQDYETQIYTTFLIYWAPLYLAAFIAANTAALRERETTTAEMFRSTPTRYTDRTLALLAAGLVPTALAAGLAGLQLSMIADAGGITVGERQVPLTPTLIEMALVPATTAAAFAAGVALARTVRSRTFGAIFGAVATYMLILLFWAFGWYPAFLLAPYATALRSVDLGGHINASDLAGARVLSGPHIDPDDLRWWVLVRDVELVGWHNAYLVGVALLLAAYAVWRSGRDRRVPWLLLPGAVLTVVGLTLQMAAFGNPLTWWEGVRGL